MLSQLEQACKTYSTESSGGLIEFDSNWQRIFVTALTLHLDQAISCYHVNVYPDNFLLDHFMDSIEIMCVNTYWYRTYTKVNVSKSSLLLKLYPFSYFDQFYPVI